MPMRLATSSAERPEPSRNAFSRLPISSKRRVKVPIPSRSFLDRLQTLRGIERGSDNALIAGAAAEIARDRDANLLLGRIGIVAQEFDQRRQHARRAESALQAMIVAERLLQGVHLVGRWRDALDGQDLVTVRLHRQHQTGTCRAAVE